MEVVDRCVCVVFFFDKRIARVFFGWESYLLNHPFFFFRTGFWTGLYCTIEYTCRGPF